MLQMLKNSFPHWAAVALHIMWRTSVLIIWRIGCKSSVRMCGVRYGSAQNRALQMPSRGRRGAREVIVCQIIRTTVGQLTSPGIGSLTATALTAAIGNGTAFRKSRDLAAWLGLVPRQHSTGGRARLLGISKRGNPYLRRLFIHGGRAVLARVKREDHSFGSWLDRLEGRSPRNVAVVAMANKLARIAWSVLTSGRAYCATAA